MLLRIWNGHIHYIGVTICSNILTWKIYERDWNVVFKLSLQNGVIVQAFMFKPPQPFFLTHHCAFIVRFVYFAGIYKHRALIFLFLFFSFWLPHEVMLHTQQARSEWDQLVKGCGILKASVLCVSTWCGPRLGHILYWAFTGTCFNSYNNTYTHLYLVKDTRISY